tara:strand:- start:1027 stop:3138 length:2112 start_codon:yes stop_codon:yes gene_type:complete
MFCYRIIIFVLFYNFIFGGLPSSPSIPEYSNQSRDFIEGWPSLGIIDLREGHDETVVAGTGAGIGIIENLYLLNSIENNLYSISDSNLPLGANPAMKTYNNGDFIVISGVTGTVDNPEGTGISWSLDGGESWQYIGQPIDADNGSAYITKYWNEIPFEQLAVTVPVKNVSYDIDVDLQYEYIYATSWAGMLQRFKYTDINPIWEIVPLPMDGQDNLSCDLSCNNSGSQNCCDYTLNQNPNQNCDTTPDDYYANPVDGTGFDNHKAFSVYVDQENNYIWVGTAYGLNRGEIISENCIEWTHYTKENTNTAIGANWTIGFHRQYLSDTVSRLWAITWEANSSTPHKLSYSDDNGDTWNNDNGLQQGIGAVTYNLNTDNNALYASTSKGLFEINPFNYGCMDIAADNYDPLATIDGNCEYGNVSIIDGCDLNDDYFYMINVESNIYKILYNSSTDIQGFNFDIIGADLESVIDDNGAASDFLFFNWDENEYGLGGNFDASTFSALPSGCGHLLTVELSNIPDGLSNISINGTECYNYYTLGAECLDDAAWSKVEIPSWIFDNLFITNEQNENFKVYTSYVYDSNSLWIGTTRGLIVADITTLPYNYYQPYLSNAETFKVYPNPYLSDRESPVIFEFESFMNGTLEIYDFSMNKVFDQTCDSNGEILTCAWYGKNGNGQKVANGVYFCKLKVDGQIYWEKLGVVNLR